MLPRCTSAGKAKVVPALNLLRCFPQRSCSIASSSSGWSETRRPGGMSSSRYPLEVVVCLGLLLVRLSDEL